MAYDEGLAERLRPLLARKKGFGEKKMFGGLCYTINGNMCCGIVKDQLMLRLGNEGAAEALKHPHARPMDFTGKPMKSMIYIVPEGIAEDEDLKAWVTKALDFAKTLPAK